MSLKMILSKLIVTVALLMVFPIFLFGQDIEQQVIASSGADFNKAQVSISWTIGEVVTETFNTSSGMLTQGFHQGNLMVNKVEDEALTDFSLKAYPNPVVDILLIETQETDLEFQIIDANGKVIMNGIFNTENAEINFTSIVPGIYFLSVDQRKAYKIIKQ